MQIFEVNMASWDGKMVHLGCCLLLFFTLKIDLNCTCVLTSCLLWVCSDGAEEPVKQISSKDGAFCYEYWPSSPGKYTVSITWGGAHIPKR